MKSDFSQDLLYIFGLSLNRRETRFSPLLALKFGDLQETAKRGKEVDLALHRRRKVSFPDGDVLESVHQFRDSHILRTSLKTGITGGAKPDELAGEDLFFHPEEGHPDNAPRVISVGYFPYRTSCRTGSARETSFDIFPARLSGNEKFEVWIEVLGVDHEA